MKKKINFLIFGLFVGILFMNNIYASNSKQFSCTYTNKDNVDDSYTLTYNTIGNKLSVEDCSHNGSTCKKDNYEFLFNNNIKLGSSSCPSSIDVIPSGDVTKIKWVGNYKGQYVYSEIWYCYRENNNDDKLYYTDVYALGFWENSFRLFGYSRFYVPDIISLNRVRDYFSGKTDVYPSNATVEKYDKKSIKFSSNLFSSDNYKNACPSVEIQHSADSNISITVCSGQGRLLRKTSPKTKVTDLDSYSSCPTFTNKDDCGNSLNTDKVACVWVEDENAAGNAGGYCNVDNLQYVGCGGSSDIPVQVPALISLAVNLLKIATPIVLIFISIVTLLKALASQKEDEIKKAKSSLIKKLISAAMVFFIIAIVQFVISKVAATDEEYEGFEDCLNCFLNNSCSNTTYYKTVVSGIDMCTPLTTGKTDYCSDLFKK